MSTTNEERYQRALISLDGLSVGDAFGAWSEMMRAQAIGRRVKDRKLPNAPWRFTDDTMMALSIVSILRQHGRIEQDLLAASFGARFEHGRGYGPGARAILTRIRIGQAWRELALSVYEGGSYGNGSAMRVAPVGAYFSDDMDAAIENARLSAEITHIHPEGVAGAIAVSVGAAIAARKRGSPAPSRQDFIEAVLPHVPDSVVRDGIAQAYDIPTGTTVFEVARVLGNGSRVSSQDTVPYVLWCAGEKLDNYEEALWLTISGGGDTDTTCAMVGGIVATHTGREGIPEQWLKAREPLPEWPFEEG